jgi:predicted ester cyclase
MSQEENKAIVRRIHAELNKGNVAIVDELYSPDYVSHVGNRTSGLGEYKEYLQAHYEAFPDWQTKIDQIFADGDTVVVRVRDRGTHKGHMQHHQMGHRAATQKRVNSTRTIIRRIRDGKVVESWINADHLGILQQVDT